MATSTEDKGAPGPTAAPPPPADFDRRILPVETVDPSTDLFRVHQETWAPVFFGPPKGRLPLYRFDAPDGSFGTLYVGFTLEAAFVEALVRNPALKLVSQTEVDRRRWSVLRASRALTLVRLFGPGLSAVGATSGVSSGGYAVSRAWSHAVWNHPSQPDGIIYRSNHDDDRLCAAIFKRPSADISAGSLPEPFSTVWLSATLREYGKALDPDR